MIIVIWGKFYIFCAWFLQSPLAKETLSFNSPPPWKAKLFETSFLTREDPKVESENVTGIKSDAGSSEKSLKVYCIESPLK